MPREPASPTLEPPKLARPDLRCADAVGLDHQCAEERPTRIDAAALCAEAAFIRKLKFVSFRDPPLGNFQERYK
jgi:hypothetical protein